MLAQKRNRKLSVIAFNEEVARRRAGASLTVLNGRVTLITGCIALWFLVAPLGASAQDIAVRLVNAKSGKPLSKIRVAMSTWNGTFDIHRPPLPHEETVEATTDGKGVAVFHLPQPIPEHAGFEIGGLRDFVGCWRLLNLSLETVMRSGVVSDYDESKCGKLRNQVSAKPGEVVIVDKKLTLGDQMRQEIP